MQALRAVAGLVDPGLQKTGINGSPARAPAKHATTIAVKRKAQPQTAGEAIPGGSSAAASNPATGTACMAWVARKCGARRSPTSRDQPMIGTVAPVSGVPTRWPGKDAMVPATIALLLVMIPAVLTALGVVREKELGSITNLYATPVTRLEFLVGKQLPYVGIGMFNFFTLLILAVYILDVPLKGSLLAISLGALLYVTATTGIGLLMSSFTRTQIAAIFGTLLGTMLPAISFSGMNTPVSSLEGGAALMGKLYPTSYFMTISRGIFTKAVGFVDLYSDFFALALFIPVLTITSLLLLKKQDT